MGDDQTNTTIDHDAGDAIGDVLNELEGAGNREQGAGKAGEDTAAFADAESPMPNADLPADAPAEPADTAPRTPNAAENPLAVERLKLVDELADLDENGGPMGIVERANEQANEQIEKNKRKIADLERDNRELRRNVRELSDRAHQHDLPRINAIKKRLDEIGRLLK